MLGRLDPQKRNAHVIGAGIAGLLIARRLDQLGYVVHLYEATDRAGGMIHTNHTVHGLSEAAANSLLGSEPVLRLCHELDVPILHVNPEAKARFIFRAGRPRKMPLNFGEILRALWLVTRKHSTPAPTRLSDWAETMVGPAAKQYLVDPFVRGIYGVSSETLDVEAAFPKLVARSDQSLLGHILNGRKRNPRTPKQTRPQMLTPAKGMQNLIDQLYQDVQRRLGDRVHLNTPITAERYSSLSGQGNMIICTPAPVARALLASISGTERLCSALSEITYTPLISVTVTLRREDFARPPQGVGVLVPEAETSAVPSVLGVLFSSSSFAKRSLDPAHVVLTVIMSGKLVELSDAEIQTRLLRDLHTLLGFRGQAWIQGLIYRWPSAIPVYDSVVKKVWTIASETLDASPGQVLFSNYTGQVSIRGMIETSTDFA